MTRILAAMIAFYVGTGYADTLTGRVIAVADGDTLTVLEANQQQHAVRLSGIDAPESDQPYGTVSGDHLERLVSDKDVAVLYDKLDRYGRIVGKVIVDNQDANLKQVQTGLAWHYKHYQSEQSLRDRERYAKAETDARNAAIGLWAEANPIAPWDWRQGVWEASHGHGCGAKRYCDEMVSCDEAIRYRFYCGLRTLDGDSDGVPCESLCS
jgi:endonuclease YncB( thermonuclease family)